MKLKNESSFAGLMLVTLSLILAYSKVFEGAKISWAIVITLAAVPFILLILGIIGIVLAKLLKGIFGGAK